MEQRAEISFEELLRQVMKDDKKYPKNAQGKAKYPLDVVKVFEGLTEPERSRVNFDQLLEHLDIKSEEIGMRFFRALRESDRTFDDAMKLNLIYEADRFINMPEELGVPVEQRTFDNLLKVGFLAESYQAWKAFSFVPADQQTLKNAFELVSRGANIEEAYEFTFGNPSKIIFPCTFDDLLKCKEWFGLKDKETGLLFRHLNDPERKFSYLQQLNLDESGEEYREAFNSLPSGEKAIGLRARAAAQNANSQVEQNDHDCRI